MASVFQKKALRRLESPEQLDKLIVVTPPLTWMIMAGASLIVIAFLAWAFFGSIIQSTTVDGIVMGDEKGSVLALVPIDEAGRIREGQSCTLSVVLGAHSGMEFEGRVSGQDIQIVSENEVAELTEDKSLSGSLMKDKAMAAVYILSDPGVSLNKGELIRARIIVSNAHPYSFLDFGKTR